MFFPLWRLVGPSQDGECGEQLTNMPFGAKYGGRHRQERALVLTSLRRTKRRCALATSDEAMVDVEVDRCIDENSASNHG